MMELQKQEILGIGCGLRCSSVLLTDNPLLVFSVSDNDSCSSVLIPRNFTF